MRKGGSWEDTVIETARVLGWRCAHFRAVETKRRGWQVPVAADGAGFPDCILVRDRIIAAELKSGTGKVTDAQRDWLERLAAAGVECYTWRETQWDEIVQILRRRDDRPS